MQIYTHTLPGGAQLIGYLRDRTVEMPAFNTRPAILILPVSYTHLTLPTNSRV